MPWTWTEVFRDDFNNATLGLTYENNNGFNSEPAGSSWVQACTSGINTDIWETNFKGPIATKALSPFTPGSYALACEVRLTALTHSANGCMTGLYLYKDHLNWYHIVHTPHDNDIMVQKTVAGVSSDIGAGQTTVDPSSTPIRFRIYYNATSLAQIVSIDGTSRSLAPGHLSMYSSIDDGVTWRLSVDEAASFVPVAFGFSTSSGWGDSLDISASYDYLSVLRCDPTDDSESTRYAHPLDSDCLGLWRMDESNDSDSAIDSSTYANHAQQYGSPTCVTGRVNGARNMALDTRRFEAPYAERYWNQDNVTVSAWVYYDGTPPGSTGIIFRMPAGDGWMHGSLSIRSDGKISWYYPSDLVDPDALTAGWHLITGTLSKSGSNYTRTIYVDGLSKNTSTDSNGPGGHREDLALLLGGDSGSAWWPGYLDEVAIYSSAKDSHWINKVYYGDTTAPAISNRSPASGSTGVALNASISLDATDSEAGTNPDSFNLNIGSTPSVINGVEQPGFSFTATPGTNKYTFTVGHASDFPGDTLESISGTVQDFAGNESSFLWSFTTLIKKYIKNAFANGIRNVHVELIESPPHSNPTAIGDALNPESYTIKILDTGEYLTILSIALTDDTKIYDIAVLEKLIDEKNVYEIKAPGLFEGDTGETFLGLVSVEDQHSKVMSNAKASLRDLANPPVIAPETGLLGGTLQIQGGDYSTEEGPTLYKKLIFRRLITKQNEFSHLPGYGKGMKLKEPLSFSDIAQEERDIKAEVMKEAETADASAKIILDAENHISTILIKAKMKTTGQDVPMTFANNDGSLVML